MELKAAGVEKWYLRGRGGSNRFYAVPRTDLTLEPGTVTVLTGKSGSGKTTLLNMMSGLLVPNGGQVLAEGQDLYALDDEELSRFRNGHFGMIPQSAAALQSLTVMENILLVRGIYKEDGSRMEETAQKAEELLEKLQISQLADVYPSELSGGELRRMAVARALAPAPDVVFADEPTSDLDEENTAIVLQLLKEAAQNGAAVFVVTHDPEAVRYADRHITAARLFRPETAGEEI